MADTSTQQKKEVVLEDRDFTALIKQVKTEKRQAYDHIKPKWDKWAARLKLYNNQRRDEEAVGDNTLFTIFNTVLASLYTDRMTVTHLAREIGDEEVAENLDLTAEYDYEVMEKDMLDYEWIWETMFFGRGLVMLMEFDQDKKAPVPELWNVMTVLRDPYAISINGDRRRRGAARYLGRELRMTKQEMKDMDVYFNYEDLKPQGTSTRSLVDENMRITAEAAGLSDASRFNSVDGENQTHRLLEWFTIYNGKRVFVTLADDCRKVVRYKELDSLDIPIVDRTIYHVPNSWDSVSIPDLVEDKQRARAIMSNLSVNIVKSHLHPMYLYDSTRITNKADLNFGFNKFVPVQGNPTGAVQVMPKEQIKNDVAFIMDTLDMGAQKATATPDMQQGGTDDQGRTATELAIVNQKVDTRYSLAAKIFGWSEKRFWRRWYMLYKKHFVEGISEKTVRISGVMGAQWRPFTRENLVCKVDPDVQVESRTVSEAQRFNDLKLFQQYIQNLAIDQSADLRFGLRHMGKLNGFSKDVIDRLLPPTIEEMRAEEENEAMRNNKKVEVLLTDDHAAHLQIHNKMEDTASKIAHMKAHKKAMILQRVRPELFPPTPEQTNPQMMPQGGPPEMTPERPAGRALPMKQPNQQTAPRP